MGVPGVQQTRPKRQPHGGRILHGTRQVGYLYFNTFIYRDELIVASKKSKLSCELFGDLFGISYAQIKKS